LRITENLQKMGVLAAASVRFRDVIMRNRTATTTLTKVVAEISHDAFLE
jgi:hypothetical protein